MADPFTIDEAYDLPTASHGDSRYGRYLAINASWFEDEPGHVTTDPVGFTSAAFAVASSPNMAPGYVRHHTRISAAEVSRNWEDGSLLADVTVTVLGPPEDLKSLPGWSSWAVEHGAYVEPSARALARRPAMLTSTRLLFSISPDRLYVPADAPGRVTVSDAKAAVARLVDLLNGMARPVLNQLEGGL